MGQLHDADAPLPNLPLPRELRDQIWAYLLDGNEVLAAPYRDRADIHALSSTSRRKYRNKSRAHTYNFHTNIFAVNREIQAEAEKVFHERNALIAVILGGPKILSLVHDFGLPMISESRHIKAATPRIFARLKFLHPLQTEETPIYCCLMLLRDFPVLRNLMQWLFLMMSMPASIRSHDAETPLVTFGAIGEPGSTSLELYLRPAVPSFEKRFGNLVADLEDLKLPGSALKVRFADVDADTQHSQDALQAFEALFEQRIGKDTLRATDLLWLVSDTLSVLKTGADSLVDQEEYDAAQMRYAHMARALHYWDFLVDNILELCSSKATRTVMVLILHQVLDNLAMLCQLHLRSCNFESASRLSNGVVAAISGLWIAMPGTTAELEPFGALRWLMRSGIYHTMTLIDLLDACENVEPSRSLAPGSAPPPSLDHAHATLHSLLKDHPNDEYCRHDFAVVNEIFRDEKVQ
ncbi:Hypothetical predicted protein [Lecanosticta acicola]|uniref:Uncharacterized protein n=1 Tax=Lecanosticta acicola TaxID=111012 RepID=A0AAI8YT06_9PEZI|nr:Hypothetical predicted protein [Lecanosticta acicola]